MSVSRKSHEETSATVSSTPASASTYPVPATVSVPPEGWVDPGTISRKWRRPQNGLPIVAATVASELRSNSAALSQELGSKSVDPLQLAAALDLANQWEGVDDKATTFRRYARVQRNANWDAAITLMDAMRDGVRLAVARDPSFAQRFPDVAKTFAPVKRPRKKKGATAAAPAASSASSTPTAPAEPAPKA